MALNLIYLFLLLSSKAFQIPVSGLQVLPVESKRTPLCIISSWEEGNLPDYAFNAFESLITSEKYIKLHLFHYKTKNLPPVNKYQKLEMIDIAKIDDGAYAKDGFSEFLTKRICEIFEVNSDKTSEEYRMLKSAITYLQYRPKSAPAMCQLRGMYGRIFEKWINSNVCDSWAWADLDVIFGDLKGWMEGNLLIWDMDVFTLSGTDWDSIYTRGQFTAHNLLRNPEKVNNIWKYCNYFDSISTLSKAFVYSGLCIDEGCYGRAVFDSNLKFGVFPWQGNDWDSQNIKYAAFLENRLWVAKKCDSNPDCRTTLIKDLAQMKEHRDFISGKIFNKSALEVASTEVINVTRVDIDTTKKGCLWWIADTYKTCAAQGHGIKTPGYQYFIYIENSKMEMILWHYKPLNKKQLILESGEFEYLEESTSVELSKMIREKMVFHFSHWKSKLRHNEINNSKFGSVIIELSKYMTE